jgi:EAL and modified HD-GYP domain-containing signal transduction protein
MEIFVARQPIFTARKTLFGYELLFRQGFENIFPDIDGDTATSSILSNTFFSFEINEITGNRPALINFTKKLILQKTPLLFPPRRIIIEVLENIEPEPKIVAALDEFKSNGFTIALDDFIYHKKFRPMMKLCKIIKFDIIATPLETLENTIKEISTNYNIMLLAEKVETYEEFQLAKQMGFTLFQGYFFAKPEIISKKDIPAVQITRLKLISETGRRDPDLKKIENLIKKDVSVSFKLLKFINSAYFKRPTPINTIKDAITYLGIDELKKFINVIAISELNKGKPNELVRSAVIRARMCEQCADLFTTDFTGEELFTLGLFSVIDAMLDNEMEIILRNIAFSPKIKNALMGRDKNFKKILDIVINFEQGRWDNAFYALMSNTPAEKKLLEFYFDAVRMSGSFLD